MANYDLIKTVKVYLSDSYESIENAVVVEVPLYEFDVFSTFDPSKVTLTSDLYGVTGDSYRYLIFAPFSEDLEYNPDGPYFAVGYRNGSNYFRFKGPPNIPQADSFSGASYGFCLIASPNSTIYYAMNRSSETGNYTAVRMYSTFPGYDQYINARTIFTWKSLQTGSALALRRDSPEQYSVSLNRGQSQEYSFTLLVDSNPDNNITPFTDITFKTYYDNELGWIPITDTGAFDVSGTTITPTEQNYKSQWTIRAYVNGYLNPEGEEIFSLLEIIVNNPVGPYSPGGDSTGGWGGNGSFDDGTSSVYPSPDGSAESNFASSGLFTMYAMDTSDLASVGAALFSSGFLESAVMDLVKIAFGSPIEATISLMSFPFNVPAGASGHVKYGAGELYDYENLTYATGSPLTSPFMTIDWGSIDISEYWDNFLDYAPHTKIELYLPWCSGVVNIDPNDVMGGSLRVTTNIELAKGSCVHNVTGKINIGSFGGNCGHPLPITAIDTSGKALGIITTGIATATSLALGGAARSADIAAANEWRPPLTNLDMPLHERTAAQLSAGEAAAAPWRQRARRSSVIASGTALAAGRAQINFPRSGSFGIGAAGLGVQHPYVVITRPIQNVPDGYGTQYGYPCNVFYRLGDLSGYAEIGSVHLDGFSCTGPEREEIEELLRGGVIF